MGTSTLTSLAELKMHIRSEHQERSTKLRIKHLFDCQLRTSLSNDVPVPGPPPPDLEPATAFSTLPASEVPTSGLSHLVPNDTADDEPGFAGAEDPISLASLFDFNND